MTWTAERLPNNPVVHPAMPGLAGDAGANVNGPSLLRVPDWVPNPLGRYYLYFAHHGGQYIRLAYADDPAGPFTVYAPGVLPLAAAPCRSHVASPDVHVDPAERRLRLYFHGCVDPDNAYSFVQVTFVAFSTDGLHWDVQPRILAPFYLRAWRGADAWYGIAKDANTGGMLLRSPDGIAPFEPGPTIIDRMRHAAVLPGADAVTIVCSRAMDTPERLLVTRMATTGDWRQWRPEPLSELLAPDKPWEGADCPLEPSRWGSVFGRVRQLRDPAIYVEGDRRWLYYSVAGEHALAVAALFRQSPPS